MSSSISSDEGSEKIKFFRFEEKTRLPAKRIPQELAAGVYESDDEKIRKTKSGNHRLLKCQLYPVPDGSMVAVPLEGIKPKEPQQLSKEDHLDPEAEYEEVQMGSLVVRRKKGELPDQSSPSNPPEAEQTDENTELSAPHELTALQGMLKSGNSKINLKLSNLNPAGKSKSPKDFGIVRRIWSAVAATIYAFVMRLFALMKAPCCCFGLISAKV